jgi:hypothetical protein
MATDESKRTPGRENDRAVATGERDEPTGDNEDLSLAAGDDSVERAIGRGGARKIAGTGSTAGQSGRLTSEGTGPTSNPPAAGEPGGMGGVRARSGARDHRPPGGVSLVAGKKRESSTE